MQNKINQQKPEKQPLPITLDLSEEYPIKDIQPDALGLTKPVTIMFKQYFPSLFPEIREVKS
jgi:hypothetical protein